MLQRLGGFYKSHKQIGSQMKIFCYVQMWKGNYTTENCEEKAKLYMCTRKTISRGHFGLEELTVREIRVGKGLHISKV